MNSLIDGEPANNAQYAEFQLPDEGPFEAHQPAPVFQQEIIEPAQAEVAVTKEQLVKLVGVVGQLIDGTRRTVLDHQLANTLVGDYTGEENPNKGMWN